MNVDNEMMFFEVSFIRETEKAILVQYQDTDIWLPKSIAVIPDDAEVDKLIEVQVPVWFARKNSMI